MAADLPSADSHTHTHTQGKSSVKISEERIGQLWRDAMVELIAANKVEHIIVVDRMSKEDQLKLSAFAVRVWNEALQSSSMPAVDEGRADAMRKALHQPGICSRCKQPIRDFEPPSEGMTAGYYVAAGWEKYCNPGEVYVCDACMWKDPRYLADYGAQPTSRVERWLFVDDATPEDPWVAEWGVYANVKEASESLAPRARFFPESRFRVVRLVEMRQGEEIVSTEQQQNKEWNLQAAHDDRRKYLAEIARLRSVSVPNDGEGVEGTVIEGRIGEARYGCIVNIPFPIGTRVRVTVLNPTALTTVEDGTL
jgi:hypothetical protein